MVNVHCDYTSIYVCVYIYMYMCDMYIHLVCLLLVFFARQMHSTNRIHNDSSEQVCDSCWIRHGGMNPLGNTFPGRKLEPPT